MLMSDEVKNDILEKMDQNLHNEFFIHFVCSLKFTVKNQEIKYLHSGFIACTCTHLS